MSLYESDRYFIVILNTRLCFIQESSKGTNLLSFLDTLAKWGREIISFVISVCPSFRME